MFMLSIALFAIGCGWLQGPEGPIGLSGAPGVSAGCSVSTVAATNIVPSGGALITCVNGTSALVLNGVNGLNGSVFSLQPFCPNVKGFDANSSYGANGFQEYYIAMNGQDYAIMDSGTATGVFLTLVVPGTYDTSDTGGCKFMVNANGSITVL